MPETPEEFYARTKDALRMPPLEEWETFPFEGEIRLRELQPPAEDEKRRFGEGGIDCRACSTTADDRIWEDEHWQLTAVGPTGLPIVLILEPKGHYDIETLPAELAVDLGPLMQRIERAFEPVKLNYDLLGNSLPHLHTHVVPRYADDPKPGWPFPFPEDEPEPIDDDELRRDVQALRAPG